MGKRARRGRIDRHPADRVFDLGRAAGIVTVSRRAAVIVRVPVHRTLLF
jgi:hypothetical protein